MTSPVCWKVSIPEPLHNRVNNLFFSGPSTCLVLRYSSFLPLLYIIRPVKLVAGDRSWLIESAIFVSSLTGRDLREYFALPYPVSRLLTTSGRYRRYNAFHHVAAGRCWPGIDRQCILAW